MFLVCCKLTLRIIKYRMNTTRQSKYVIVNSEILVTYMNDTNICIRLLNSLLSNFLA